MKKTRRARRIATLCCAISLSAAAAGAAAAAAPTSKQVKSKDPLEPARAALRTLQFDKAITLLSAAGNAGDAEAQYLLALMYLNGVGVVPDPVHGRQLLQASAEHGHGAAAYVLAGEFGRDPAAPPEAAHQWLERAARQGYYRAVDALKSGRPLLDREVVGASDPTLMIPWVMDCVRRNDAAELRRLGPVGASVRDQFGRTSLSHAAEVGSLSAAAVLLEMGADVRAVDQAGVTALMIAAERPEQAMVDLLLKHGADSQAADGQKRTALFYAARANRVDNLRALQLAGTALDARDSRGYNALDAALGVDADAAIAELRSLGVHANRITGELARQSGKFDPAHPGDLYRGWPALALAVARNDTASVQQLLAAGADVNLRLPQGDPLLQVAADAHALPSLSLLLARGADATTTDHAGHTALWLAASRNDPEVVKALLDAGVKPDFHAAAEQTPLLCALRAKHPEVAEALLAAGATVEATDEEGRTPLMLASAAGEAEVVRLLIEHRAQVNAEDHGHRSALMYAAAAGSRDAVGALMAAGANPKATDARGLTVLHAAATSAHAGAGLLAALLAADLPVNKRDSAGDTPLMIAAAMGHVDVVQALLARSPELDVQNGVGDTALIAATRAGHTGICHMLITAGANKLLRNGSGVTASDVAVGRGFTPIAKELAGNG